MEDSNITTVVFSEKFVASDSQSTANNIRFKGTFTKIYESDDTIIGIAGVAAQCLRIVAWIQAGMVEEEAPYIPELEEPEYQIVFVNRHTKQKYTIEGRYLDVMPVEDEYLAIGSGADIALGAMSAAKRLSGKCDTKRAIKASLKAAIEFDILSGGDIKVVKI